MARRKKGKEAEMVGAVAVLLIFGIGTAISSLSNSLGFGTLVALCIGVILLIVVLAANKKKRRIEYLTKKYGDATVVEYIYNRRYWQGQTSEQLIDSLGNPHGVDRKLLKTIKREIWKYNPRGTNRYGLRITLDDDVVMTWDHKQ